MTLKNYSTSVHDVKMIGKGIKEIKNINNNSKYYNLIADKAYKTKDEYKLNDKIIKIKTQNNKNKNTK